MIASDPLSLEKGNTYANFLASGTKPVAKDKLIVCTQGLTKPG